MGEHVASRSRKNKTPVFRPNLSRHRRRNGAALKYYLTGVRKQPVVALECLRNKNLALPETFCLRDNGHLLLSSESHALLAPGDVVEVLPLEENKADRNVERAGPSEHVTGVNGNTARISHKAPLQANEREDSYSAVKVRRALALHAHQNALFAVRLAALEARIAVIEASHAQYETMREDNE